MLSKVESRTIFESLIWLDLELNPGLRGHWRSLYPLGQYTYMHVYTPRANRMEHRVNFQHGLTGSNSEVSFSRTNCNTKVKKLSLPYYLTITGRIIIGLITFLMVLTLCEMQSLVRDSKLGRRIHFLIR